MRIDRFADAIHARLLASKEEEQQVWDGHKHFWLCRQTAVAERVGFDVFQLGEYHYNDLVLSPPEVAPAAIFTAHVPGFPSQGRVCARRTRLSRSGPLSQMSSRSSRRSLDDLRKSYPVRGASRVFEKSRAPSSGGRSRNRFASTTLGLWRSAW